MLSLCHPWKVCCAPGSHGTASCRGFCSVPTADIRYACGLPAANRALDACQNCLGLYIHELKRHDFLEINEWLPSQAIRSVIAAHTGVAPPPLALQPPAAAYGRLALSQHVTLLDALPVLAPGDGVPAEVPARMEAYGQLCAPDVG